MPLCTIGAAAVIFWRQSSVRNLGLLSLLLLLSWPGVPSDVIERRSDRHCYRFVSYIGIPSYPWLPLRTNSPPHRAPRRLWPTMPVYVTFSLRGVAPPTSSLPVIHGAVRSKRSCVCSGLMLRYGCSQRHLLQYKARLEECLLLAKLAEGLPANAANEALLPKSARRHIFPR